MKKPRTSDESQFGWNKLSNPDRPTSLTRNFPFSLQFFLVFLSAVPDADFDWRSPFPSLPFLSFSSIFCTPLLSLPFPPLFSNQPLSRKGRKKTKDALPACLPACQPLLPLFAFAKTSFLFWKRFLRQQKKKYNEIGKAVKQDPLPHKYLTFGNGRRWLNGSKRPSEMEKNPSPIEKKKTSSTHFIVGRTVFTSLYFPTRSWTLRKSLLSISTWPSNFPA